jgi:hypothetical protein
MRKMSIILISIVFVCDLFSQSNFNFPTSGAIWNYKILGSLSYPHEWPVIDSLGQEITIGSYPYFEVYRVALGNSQVIGAIREDTIQKLIYFHNFTDEIVLYDFTMEIGDTIYYSTNLFYDLDYFKVVDNIDSTLVNGQYRKTWFLTNSFLNMTDIWIEGIGSVYRYGLLYPNDPDIVMDNSTPYFGCFSHDTITYIDGSNCDGACPCSYWLVDIEELNENVDKISLFPNPVKNTLTIEFHEDKLTSDYLELFTCGAKPIMQMEIISKRIELDLSELNKGIYFLKLSSNENTTVRKLIRN